MQRANATGIKEGKGAWCRLSGRDSRLARGAAGAAKDGEGWCAGGRLAGDERQKERSSGEGGGVGERRERQRRGSGRRVVTAGSRRPGAKGEGRMEGRCDGWRLRSRVVVEGSGMGLGSGSAFGRRASEMGQAPKAFHLVAGDENDWPGRGVGREYSSHGRQRAPEIKMVARQPWLARSRPRPGGVRSYCCCWRCWRRGAGGSRDSRPPGQQSVCSLASDSFVVQAALEAAWTTPAKGRQARSCPLFAAPAAVQPWCGPGCGAPFG